ncbi:hypothetical protein [Hymenobacter sp. APR13]|uniref:hypothetical protein n=1 Tax=Hymenobacter sp. APR13 TaxID=1356852 RepID=UPI0012E023E6|nr:hypothetical protein [Hymenobacter sp. APR13]
MKHTAKQTFSFRSQRYKEGDEIAVDEIYLEQLVAAGLVSKKGETESATAVEVSPTLPNDPAKRETKPAISKKKKEVK